VAAAAGARRVHPAAARRGGVICGVPRECFIQREQRAYEPENDDIQRAANRFKPRSTAVIDHAKDDRLFHPPPTASSFTPFMHAHHAVHQG